MISAFTIAETLQEQLNQCKKCGNANSVVKWDPQSDMLDFKCRECGYSWSSAPLDRAPKVVNK